MSTPIIGTIFRIAIRISTAIIVSDVINSYRTFKKSAYSDVTLSMSFACIGVPHSGFPLLLIGKVCVIDMRHAPLSTFFLLKVL